jgi:DNA-binding CsgD family transcriptional regulator
LNALLQSNGFIVHRIKIDRYKSEFNHPDELHQWLGTWASHAHRISKEKQGHFLADTVSAYLDAHHYSKQAAFPYYEYVLEIICEKPLEINDDLSYHYGNITFTPNEAKVLKHFLQGKTAKEIGCALSISAKTSEFHLANIKAKLNCQRRSEIYQAAMDYGFIHYA